MYTVGTSNPWSYKMKISTAYIVSKESNFNLKKFPHNNNFFSLFQIENYMSFKFFFVVKNDITVNIYMLI